MKTYLRIRATNISARRVSAPGAAVNGTDNMARKKPFSGKQKKEQLQAKRERKKDEGNDEIRFSACSCCPCRPRRNGSLN